MNQGAVAEEVRFGEAEVAAWNAALAEKLATGKLHTLSIPLDACALGYEVRTTIYNSIYNALPYSITAPTVYERAAFLSEPWWSWDDDPEVVIVDPARKKKLRNGDLSDENAQYRGRLAARLQQAIKLRADYDMPANVLDNVAKTIANMQRGVGDWLFDFSASINWNAGDFGDSGSCYWRSNAGAKDVLEHQEDDFRAMRFYAASGERAYGNPIPRGVGRCWIVVRERTIALDSIGLTKATLKVPCVFNGYWIDEFYQKKKAYFDPNDVTSGAAHALATHLGGQKLRISLSNNGETAGKVYMNGGTYAIYPRAAFARKLSLPNSIDMRLSAPPANARCLKCRCKLNDEIRVKVDTAGGAQYFCAECYKRYFRPCAGCNRGINIEAERPYTFNGTNYCLACYQARFKDCVHCKRIYERATMKPANGDQTALVCAACYAANMTDCECCKQQVYIGFARNVFNLKQLRLEPDRQHPKRVCDNCARYRHMYCEGCNRYVTRDALVRYGDKQVCLTCHIRGRGGNAQAELTRCDNCGQAFGARRSPYGGYIDGGGFTLHGALCATCKDGTDQGVMYA